MKFLFHIVISTLVMLAGTKNLLVQVDYAIHRDFYEAHCINKNKPEMQCHGKCQMKKEAEKNEIQNELVKLSFEFNVIPLDDIEIPRIILAFSVVKKLRFYHSTDHLVQGFKEILPRPPQV